MAWAMMRNPACRGVVAILEIVSASLTALTFSLTLAACSRAEQEPVSAPRAGSGLSEVVLDQVRWPTAELVEFTVTENGFSAELATDRTLKGSFTVFVPIERLDEVVTKQLALRKILRDEIASSVVNPELCVESPWLIKGDHSEVSGRTNFSASRLITIFNEAIGSHHVWGFTCDLEYASG